MIMIDCSIVTRMTAFGFICQDKPASATFEEMVVAPHTHLCCFRIGHRYRLSQEALQRPCAEPWLLAHCWPTGCSLRA